MGTYRKHVIHLFSAPRPYRPESLEKRKVREEERLEQLDQERFQRLAEARKRLSRRNQKDRD